MSRTPIITNIVLFICFNATVFAQIEIEALPGEYIVARNYGGKTELKRFLAQEMDYPEVALKNKTEGTVVLSFIVDGKDGKTRDLKINKSVSKELDFEAVRLFSMLLFVPSYYKGGSVNTRNSLKIKFSIKSYRRFVNKRGYKRSFSNDGLINEGNYLVYQDNEVDVKPKLIFKDSLENISSFIYKNLKYPEGTLKLNITGTVKLFFIVEASGRITNIKVLNGLGGGATNEAERLLRLTKWEAGIKDGKRVRVSKVFEVNFDLSNDSDIDYIPTNY